MIQIQVFQCAGDGRREPWCLGVFYLNGPVLSVFLPEQIYLGTGVSGPEGKFLVALAYEKFRPTDFIAQITQHIPDTGAQMVRYYGWYSNKSRGLRAQRAREGGVEINLRSTVSSLQPDSVDVNDYQPRRVASKKWRELIKKVWEVDPLICPHCQGEMKMIALIDEAEVISRILKHLGLWPEFQSVSQPAERERGPPVAETWATGFRDPMPNYDVEPVMVVHADEAEDLPDPMPNYDVEEVVFTE